MLELQTIYRDYLGDAPSTGTTLGDSALLDLKDIERIVRVSGLIDQKRRRDNFDDLLGQRLQFKVSLSTLLQCIFSLRPDKRL